MLQGSNKINVIPPAASAEIDTRLVPGEKLDRWIAELRGVIKDDTIKIEPILSFEANASPTDSDLVKSVAAISKQRYPEAIITYPVLRRLHRQPLFPRPGRDELRLLSFRRAAARTGRRLSRQR